MTFRPSLHSSLTTGFTEELRSLEHPALIQGRRMVFIDVEQQGGRELLARSGAGLSIRAYLH